MSPCIAYCTTCLLYTHLAIIRCYMIRFVSAVARATERCDTVTDYLRRFNCAVLSAISSVTASAARRGAVARRVARAPDDALMRSARGPNIIQQQYQYARIHRRTRKIHAYMNL